MNWNYYVLNCYINADAGNVGVTIKIVPPAQSIIKIINMQISPYGNWAASHPVGALIGGNVSMRLIQETDLQLVANPIYYPNEDALYSFKTIKKDAIIGVEDYLTLGATTALAVDEKLRLLMSAFISTAALPNVSATLGNTTLTIDKQLITGLMGND